jgi:hypothetical protein
LVAAFVAWQSPWLLALQHLSSATRGRLEPLARRREMLLSALFATYPTVVDRAVMQAARVEARLRECAAEPEQPEVAVGHAAFQTGN